MNPNNMTPDNKNLLLAIMLSLAVMFAFYHFIDRPNAKRQAEIKDRQVEQVLNEKPAALPETALVKTDAPKARDEVLSQGGRVKIMTPSLHGSINLTGGRLDDVTLARYFETIEKKDEVTLLSPAGTATPYYVDYGILGDDKSGIKLPDDKTVWKSDRNELTPEQPVTLRHDNGQGLVFERVIAIDDHYMISVTQRVTNKTGKDVSLYPFARIVRPHVTPYPGHFRGERSYAILHEGPLGYLGGKLTEWNYKKLSEEEKAPQQIVGAESSGGWLGMTDKYWLVALVPDQKENIAARFVRTGQLEKSGSWPFRKTVGDTRDFQVDYRGQAWTIPAQGSADYTSHIFAGAKEVNQLDVYEKTLGVPRFDLAVDFGWFYFLTKPLFYVLDWLGKHVGNFGLALIILTVCVRLAVFPLASKSAYSMAKMKKLGPQIKELQARHKDEPAKAQAEIMGLYKREKFNPLSGCFPILIQIPVFFALYKVLFVTIEMRHAPFIGWIHDLSAPDTTSLLTLFGLIPWHPPINIGILPVFMGLTMWIQMKLNPPPPDPTQRAMFAWMPLLFTFMLASFPTGLIIYWTCSNLLGILQQLFIMKKMKALEEK